MKVALGQRIQPPPWGGSNQFVALLAEALIARGDSVAFDLAAGDLDLIVLTDPRFRNPAVAFTPGAVLRALLGRNRRALVVHRVNECDERKGTRTMNPRLRLANYCADHTVFIGSWLRELAVWRREGPASVILNGADTRLFNPRGQRPWDGTAPLRLVTHHWGAHPLKGFDVYARLDSMLAEPGWRGRLEFTYVGNLPAGFAFAHARRLAPMDIAAVAGELRRHHLYVTASVNEPAGMHHIEGALSGLPLLYRRSGALPEYCAGFGEAFDGPEDFERALRAMIEGYAGWRAKLAAYPHTAGAMCGAYLALFDDLVAGRDRILGQRRLWRDPLAMALNQIPW